MRSRTDSEILSWIANVGGTEMFLENAFSGMCDAFRADRAIGQHAKIEWNIRTPDLGVVRYHVVVKDGTCTAEKGDMPAPNVVLDTDLANFLRLMLGALDSGEAVDSGKLSVSGDRELAGSISGWFQGSN